MKRKTLAICIAVVTFVLALGILLYPLISTAYNNSHQAQVQVQYQQQMEQANTAAIDKARADAEAYNATIKPGTILSDAFSQDALWSTSGNYNELLNVTGSGIMGYVRIPNIGVELPIYHGTSDQVLQRGAGHLLGTSLPVGGVSTHTVITAHSGMASAKMFSDLDTVQIGDVFYLNILGETLAYQVDQVKIVLPHDTTYLGIAEGADYCTLVTCTPFGVNTHRLLVRGHRIPYEEAEIVKEEQNPTEDTSVASTWEQEYQKAILIALSIVVVFILAMFLFRLWLKNRRK